MNVNSAIGIISAIALLVPVLLILALRLFNNRSFLALLFYYLIVCVQILMRLNVISTTKSVYQSLGIVDNFLDAPLMLVFLMFFSTSVLMKKRLTTSILLFLCFEAIVICFYGFNVNSVKIILGPDIALIAGLSFMLFLRNVRLTVTNSKALGKAVMMSSLLLSYVLFSLVYIFYYIARNTRYNRDAQLIYYLVTFISALLMSVGIIIESKRIKKLDELKHTRRELAAIYGQTKMHVLNKDGRLVP